VTVLVRRRDNKWVHVPEDAVTSAVASGEVGFLSTDKVPVRAPDGAFYMLDAGEAVEAISKYGGRYDAVGMLRKRQADIQKESTGNVEAALAPIIGFTDIATLGGASEMRAGLEYVLGGSAGEKFERERTQAIRETFPKLTFGGEALASFLPLEGLGVGAKVAATSREAIAAGLLKKGSSELKAKTLSKAAGSVVQNTIEGGIIGGQAALTDIALGRTNDYTEHFVGSVGFGGMLGGGVAGALHLPGLGATGLKSGIGALWERATGEKMIDWSYKKALGAVLKTSDVSEDALRFFEGSEGRKMAALAVSTSKEMESAAYKGMSIFNEGEAVNKALAGEMLGGIKAETIRGLVPPMSFTPAVEKIGVVLGEVQKNLAVLNRSTMKSGRIQVAIKLKGVLDDLNLEFQQLANPTSKVTGPLGKADMGGNLFLFGDKLKKVLDDRLSKIKVPYGNERADGAYAGMRAALMSLRTHLEDGVVYGGAATLQKEINTATARYLDFRKSDIVRAMSRKLPRRGFGRQEVTGRETAFKAMVDKSSPTALSDPGNPLRNLRDYNQARAELAEVAAKYYDADGLQVAASAARKNADDFGRWFTETAERGKAIDQFKRIAGAHSTIAGVPAIARRVTNLAQWGGLGAGFYAGTPLTMIPFTALYAGTKALEMIAQPVKMVKLLGAIERKRVLNTQRMTKAVNETFKPLKKGESPVLRAIERVAVPSAVLKTRFVPRPVGRPAENDKDASTLSGMYKQRLRELAILKVDPQRVGEAVWKGSEQHPDLPSRFLVTAQLQMHKIVDYLVDTAPKPEVGLMTPEWEPDPGALATWTRRADVVNDPIGVMERALGGMVSQEELDTLNVCYPTLYEEMRQAVMANIGPKDWAKMTYDLRVSVGSFLNMPTDPSLEPSFTAQMLRQYDEAATAPPPVAGLPKRDQMGRFSSKSKGFADERAALVTEKFG